MDTDGDIGNAASEAVKSDDDTEDPFGAPLPKKSRQATPSHSKPSLISDSQGVPMSVPAEIHHPHSTEWFPAEHVGEYVSSRLCTALDKQTRAKLRSECPRPSLHSKMSSTPAIDPSLLTLDKAWSTCQDKLLDVISPLTRIFDLVDLARFDHIPVNPKELLLLVPSAVCLLSNANAAITHERRKGLLLKLDPKLVNLAVSNPGIKAEGMLFGDSFIKEFSKLIQHQSSPLPSQSSLNRQTSNCARKNGSEKKNTWLSVLLDIGEDIFSDGSLKIVHLPVSMEFDTLEKIGRCRALQFLRTFSMQRFQGYRFIFTKKEEVTFEFIQVVE
ncbi:hypothetical protein NDU88_004046 [Pleurodeles waltl]|uniref:Uncharacterized protein n=1 Tax=Pleurodeles waltl TaxID=8319 RepID=A0AAV7VJ36_PLEWA|nr:hypothetical protein NDU88_004046 [Pleurodeles waltl]